MATCLFAVLLAVSWCECKHGSFRRLFGGNLDNVLRPSEDFDFQDRGSNPSRSRFRLPHLDETEIFSDPDLPFASTLLGRSTQGKGSSSSDLLDGAFSFLDSGSIGSHSSSGLLEESGDDEFRHDKETDLLGSMKNALSKGVRAHQAAVAELEREEKHGIALAQDIEQRKQKLQKHHQLVTQWAMCMKQHQQQQQQQASLLEAQSAVHKRKGTQNIDKDGQDEQNSNEEKNSETSSINSKINNDKDEDKTDANSKKNHNNNSHNNVCSVHKDCSSCTSNPLCGWCKQDQAGRGSCWPHNVNAPAVALSSSSSSRAAASLLETPLALDGLMSGMCAAQNWSTEVTGRITALTLNVFSSDKRRLAERISQTIDLIHSASPDFVAFQEIDDETLRAFKTAFPESAPYFHSDLGAGVTSGQLHLMSRYPVSEVRYFESGSPGQVETDARARVLLLHATVQREEVLVATTCLDWRSELSRAKGLHFVLNTLHTTPLSEPGASAALFRSQGRANGSKNSQAAEPPRHIVLLGDFKAGTSELSWLDSGDSGFVDVWSALQDETDPGFTWDPASNAYALSVDPQSSPSRIDRMLVSSTRLKPIAISLVGCGGGDLMCSAMSQSQRLQGVGAGAAAAVASPNSFPSPHYGLLGTISLFQPTC
eukprot:CAMPEP_0175125434 /NCGR_PEP_ID=MMETSP0087-20121206/3313_1 /TAXON_ID=136419 /ORGANISM="Unknown Unknown, Strain D1" /LENGTH=652 /DNA_ID=CAMNT_0016407269 /DNA_START=52 /DNA_END=2010 /DNA_ORIENTATION=+